MQTNAWIYNKECPACPGAAFGNTFRDVSGIRSHSPLLQKCLNKKRDRSICSCLYVIRLGLEPKTPTLKVLCSTNRASGSPMCFILKAGAKVRFFCDIRKETGFYLIHVNTSATFRNFFAYAAVLVRDIILPVSLSFSCVLCGASWVCLLLRQRVSRLPVPDRRECVRSIRKR